MCLCLLSRLVFFSVSVICDILFCVPSVAFRLVVLSRIPHGNVKPYNVKYVPFFVVLHHMFSYGTGLFCICPQPRYIFGEPLAPIVSSSATAAAVRSADGSVRRAATAVGSTVATVAAASTVAVAVLALVLVTFAGPRSAARRVVGARRRLAPMDLWPSCSDTCSNIRHTLSKNSRSALLFHICSQPIAHSNVSTQITLFRLPPPAYFSYKLNTHTKTND